MTAGKGFAVVASEVKELASQTGKATEEISGQITAIQSATAEAVEAIQMIANTMHEINEYTSGIASAVEQQGAATAEISSNVQQAATGTREVAENIAGVTEAADRHQPFRRRGRKRINRRHRPNSGIAGGSRQHSWRAWPQHKPRSPFPLPACPVR